MKLTPISIHIDTVPNDFHTLLSGARLYDSSSSAEAKVIYIDKNTGYFLKSAPIGTLSDEALMTGYFHFKGLSAKVLSYISKDEKDWLLTEKICGEDGIAKKYLDDPIRLCDMFAEKLNALHGLDYSDCPLQNHTSKYLAGAEKNYCAGYFNKSLYGTKFVFACADEAWEIVKTQRHLLKTNTLIHGDYCLPNILLDEWKFSGFIDLGNGGVGDRHVDLFWGVYTLCLNLKTDKFCNRFYDVYGRENIDWDILRLISAIEVFG